MDVKGTEKAYDSGRWKGMSMRTTSMNAVRTGNGPSRMQLQTFLIVDTTGVLFDLNKLVPLRRPLLVQECFRDPSEEVGGIDGFLDGRMSNRRLSYRHHRGPHPFHKRHEAGDVIASIGGRLDIDFGFTVQEAMFVLFLVCGRLPRSSNRILSSLDLDHGV